MIHEQIIIACLTAEKYGCDLPLGKWFTNHKIDEELRNEKLLLVNNFKTMSLKNSWKLWLKNFKLD